VRFEENPLDQDALNRIYDGADREIAHYPQSGTSVFDACRKFRKQERSSNRRRSDADGSNRHTLPAVGAPVWSPDGTWLAYTRVDRLTPAPPGQPRQPEASLWIVHSNGARAA
jgi:hypothetical protein